MVDKGIIEFLIVKYYFIFFRRLLRKTNPLSQISKHRSGKYHRDQQDDQHL